MSDLTAKSDFIEVINLIIRLRNQVRPYNNSPGYGLHYRFLTLEDYRQKIIHNIGSVRIPPDNIGVHTHETRITHVLECCLNHSDEVFIKENEDAKIIHEELLGCIPSKSASI